MGWRRQERGDEREGEARCKFTTDLDTRIKKIVRELYRSYINDE